MPAKIVPLSVKFITMRCCTATIWNDTTVDTDNRIAWFEARTLLGYPVLVSEEEGVVTGYASFGDWRAFDGFAIRWNTRFTFIPIIRAKALVDC